jgi:micrococcal nuclease
MTYKLSLRGWRFIVLLTSLLALYSPAWAQSADEAPTVCPLTAGPSRAVTGVIDAETLKLDDGTEVRLIGALAPRPPDSTLDLTSWPPERAAFSELERLVLGRSITLGFAGRRTDRYGRTLAHVFVDAPHPQGRTPDPNNRIWVQAHMLATGHARAYALKDSAGCMRELAAHETVARTANLGLWSHAAYQVRSADVAYDVSRFRSTFQIIEGTVGTVIQGKSNLILRFGAAPDVAKPADAAEISDLPSTRNFSITIKPGIAREWRGPGTLTLTELEGRRVRVRGWIERRGGPTIEILDAHQIEVADEDQSRSSADLVSAEPEPAAPPARRRNRRTSQATSTAQ